MKCLRVRSSESAPWTLFYSSIEGFSFEEGNAYELEVATSRNVDAPADAGSIRYRLVSIVRTTKP